MPALLIGFTVGIVCYLALSIKTRFRFDDALDVIAVHLIGGLWGSLLLGLFADTAVNPIVTDEGLLLGGGLHLLGEQALASVATLAFSFTVSWLLATGLHRTIGMRITPAEETEGMDLALHSESAYAFGDIGSGRP